MGGFNVTGERGLIELEKGQTSDNPRSRGAHSLDPVGSHILF